MSTKYPPIIPLADLRPTSAAPPLPFCVDYSKRYEVCFFDKGNDRIGAIVRMVLTESDLPAPNLILRALATDQPLPPPLLRIMQRNLGTMMGLIRDGQRDGSIRRGDPQLLALSVLAQPFLLRVAARIPRDLAGVDRSDPGTQKRVVTHVVNSVHRSLATHPTHRP